MRKARLSIWFLIEVLLVIYGAMILGSGIFVWVTGNYPANVQMTNLHAPVWWGAILLAAGIFYTAKFAPRRG